MDYNARFYDSTLGRFISADTIVPGGGPQAMNRYSYVLNNFINLVDPSGHNCEDLPNGVQDLCGKQRTLSNQQRVNAGSNLCDHASDSARGACESSGVNFGISFYDVGWSQDRRVAAIQAATAIGEKFQTKYETSAQTFQRVFGAMKFVWGNNDPSTDPNHTSTDYTHQHQFTFTSGCYAFKAGGCTPDDDIYNNSVVAFNTTYAGGLDFSALVTHEFGHVVSNKFFANEAAELGMQYTAARNSILQGNLPPSTYRHASSEYGVETFADMFTAWVYDVWDTDRDRSSSAISNARAGMNSLMSPLMP